MGIGDDADTTEHSHSAEMLDISIIADALERAKERAWARKRVCVYITRLMIVIYIIKMVLEEDYPIDTEHE